MNFERPQQPDPELTTRTRGSLAEGSSSHGASASRTSGTEALGTNAPSTSSLRPGDDDGSEITVISKKPPQQFCTSGFDWRKVGELLIGRQLGSFRLDSLLGVGGMGAVFQATDLQLHRQVAVKVLNSSENDPEAERRFRVEAQSAARLDHQNIARVFHVGQDQGWNYIVLELVEGQTLRQLVTTRGPLSASLAIHIFRQLASALDHAHQRNIIHRDIKPSNVLVTEDHSIKIVDMGLARIQRAVDSADHDAEEGMTLGTFDYIAPEQARDARLADQQSDLYSLGCTLFYALVGRPPFADGTTIEKILSHSNAPRPSVLESRPDLPPAMERLVQHLMAPRREDRIGTAREFEQRLLELRAEMGRSRRPAPIRPSQDLARKRVPLMLFGMTVALVLISLIWDGPWRDSPMRLPEWPALPSFPAVATTVETLDAADLDLKTNAAGSNDNRVSRLSTNSLENLTNIDAANLTPGEEVTTNATLDISRSGNGDMFPEIGVAGTTGGNVLTDESGLFVRPSIDKPFQFQTPDIFLPFLNRERDPISSQIEWWRRPSRSGDEMNLPLGSNPIPGRSVERTNDGIRQPDSETVNPEEVTTIQVVPLYGTTNASSVANDPSETATLNSVRVASFSEAIDRLPQFPNVRRIELNFSGVHAVSSLVVPGGSLREIRAAAGQQPVLYFGQNPASSSSTGTPGVLIEGGNLEVLGVAFAWETNRDDSAALFEITEVSRVSFKNCSFQHVEPSARASAVSTGVNRTDPALPEDRAMQKNVGASWLRIDSSTSSTIDGPKQGTLTLNQCALHGPIHGVDLQCRQSISLRLTDCLVSTLASAIVIHRPNESSLANRLEIHLERSSLFARRGVVAFEVPRQPRSAEVSMFAQDCLLVAADPGVGLLHHPTRTQPAAGWPMDRGQTFGQAEDWQTFADSNLFFEGFNNSLVASYLWTLAAEDGTVSASADSTQIRTAKWFQQDLARYRSMTTLAGNELLRLMRAPASNLTWPELYGAIGQDANEHGVSIGKLPKFPIIASPVATPRP